MAVLVLSRGQLKFLALGDSCTCMVPDVRVVRMVVVDVVTGSSVTVVV